MTETTKQKRVRGLNERPDRVRLICLILELIEQYQPVTTEKLARRTGQEPKQVSALLRLYKKDGIVALRGGKWTLT